MSNNIYYYIITYSFIISYMVICLVIRFSIIVFINTCDFNINLFIYSLSYSYLLFYSYLLSYYLFYIAIPIVIVLLLFNLVPL